jgi:phage terminase large subunit
VTAVEGAYYAPFLTMAKEQKRITRVSFDPNMRVRIYVDIGGTGAKADAFAMWPTSSSTGKSAPETITRRKASR